MDGFIGRKNELNLLRKLFDNRIANLVVVRGRRRIGKSRLIAEFATPYKYYPFEGLMPRRGITAQDQRSEFARLLSKYFGLPALKADNWGDLFDALVSQTRRGRIIILFDEVSWMALGDPDFLGKLKIAWDNGFKQNVNLTLFLCSSISPWIEKNLVGSSGYLGRPSLDLSLQELPLPRCNEFLEQSIGRISSYEKLKILSVTGGVPRYLELINKKMTADQNIQNLFFSKESPLFEEFNYIFTDVYASRNKIYKSIMRSLVGKTMAPNEISEATNIARTGDLSEYLKDLELGGFIERSFTWNTVSGKISTLSTYRIKDNYSRFYLKYIEPNREAIGKGLFSERSLTTLPNWEAIQGLQFENLVINNHKAIIDILGISPELIIFSNPYFQRKQIRVEACQIDYLIQTRDTVYVCEIKFSRNKIGKSILKEVDEKLKKLKVPKYISKRAVLVHINGVTEDVEDGLFFTKIIDFSDLLEEKS